MKVKKLLKELITYLTDILGVEVYSLELVAEKVNEDVYSLIEFKKQFNYVDAIISEIKHLTDLIDIENDFDYVVRYLLDNYYKDVLSFNALTKPLNYGQDMEQHSVIASAWLGHLTYYILISLLEMYDIDVKSLINDTIIN